MRRSPSSSEDPSLVGLAVVGAERAIDHQVKTASDEFGRLHMLVRVAMATMAGMLAVVGLLTNVGLDADAFVAVTLAAGFVFVATSVVGLFVATIVRGGESGIRQGLDAADMNLLGTDESCSGPQLMAAQLAAMADAYRYNQVLLGALVRARGLAGMWLGLGLLVHLVAIAYISRGLVYG